jgi:predicted 3-demethylubiquinone-9 3-methyltransferase (glyoxalase superfamily)
MQTRVTPFLMFQRGDAEEAMRFYVATIPESRVLELERWGPDGPGAEGKVLRARFSLAGLEVSCSDSPVKHAFEFTPSTSLFVTCDSAAEVDRIAGALAFGGRFLMPLGSYDFSRRFAWVDDRFGVSWQVGLP